jgi:hypothetical protein
MEARSFPLCQHRPFGVKNHAQQKFHLTAFSWKSPEPEAAMLSGILAAA